MVGRLFHFLPRSVQHPLRRVVRSRRRKRRLKEARIVTKSEIADAIRRLGLTSGDTVFLHSSMKSLGHVNGGPDEVIDAFLEVLGTSGTLVMPAYSQPTGSMIGTLERNEIFDPLTTHSTVGLIPETFRRRGGVRRSVHPTSSVCAYGAKAEQITRDARVASSDFGVGTPLYRVMEYGGKILGLGTDLGYVSFYHVIEDVMREDFPVKVRTDQVYGAKVMDMGKLWVMKVRPLDPLISRTRIEKNEWVRDVFTEILTDRGALRIGCIGEARSWLVEAKQIFEAQKYLLTKNITIYTTEAEYKASGAPPLISYVRSYRSPFSESRHDYLGEQVSQIAATHQEQGFWDPAARNWIRQLDWNGSGWRGFVPHDWKYAMELQEGATQYAILTGDPALDEHLKDELEYIHSKIGQDGSIVGIPDGYPYAPSEYEYGAALSALSLGYVHLAKKVPSLACQLLEDVKLVSKRIFADFRPAFDDPYSIILRSSANLHLAYRTAGLSEQAEQVLEVARSYVRPFLNSQAGNGLFPFKDSEFVKETSVHAQLKADIGLLMASQLVDGDKLRSAAARNFSWVTKHLLMQTGALKWDIDNEDDFFEIHQMLYLIAYKYLRDLSSGDEFTRQAIRAWRFLLGGNRACVDLYLQNKRTTGAFFSFRYVDSNGNYQHLADQSFKGSYEIGYSLWALALNEHLSL